MILCLGDIQFFPTAFVPDVSQDMVGEKSFVVDAGCVKPQ